MEKYFQFNVKNHPFHLFSKEHLITLLLIVLLGLSVVIFRRILRKHKWDRLFRYSLAFLLIASEVSVQLWYISSNAWSARYSLPLELSDFSVLLAIVMLLTRGLTLFKFMYFAGMGSAIQALITPNLGIYSFPHFRYIEFFVSHGGVFLACIFMVAVEKVRPTLRSLWVTFLIVNVYGACIFFVDRLINANYLYIMKKPKVSSILDILGPWPWYILSLEGVVITIFFILYSPFWLTRKTKENG